MDALRRTFGFLLTVLIVFWLSSTVQGGQGWVPDGGGVKNAPRQIPPPWPADTRVVTYPAPEGEVLSADWTVEVCPGRTFGDSPFAAGRPVPVYTARVNDPPFTHLDHGGTYSFASFDFSGVVMVKIHSDFVPDYRMEQTRIMPLSTGLRHSTIDMYTTSIVLDRPTKFIFAPNGKKHPLLIFANPVEADAPKQGDPNVIYFGPGIHRPAKGVVEVKSNQTLYIAGGAVVQAAVTAVGAENITIRGRGILDGTPWPHQKGPAGRLMSLQTSKGINIEGIIIRGSWGWTIVPQGCENVTITNVKICNGRVINDDGINPVNSRHVLVRDSFVRTDDDCIAIKGLRTEWGDVDDFRVESSILWGSRARVVLFAHESRAKNMQNIVFRDIDIVHFVQTPFLFEPGDEMTIQNVRFENVRFTGDGQAVLAVLRPTVNQFMRDKVPGHIRNIQFKDIQVVGAPGQYRIVMEGYDEKHAVEGVTLENFTILGTPLTENSPNIRIGKNVIGVKVIPAASGVGK